MLTPKSPCQMITFESTASEDFTMNTTNLTCFFLEVFLEQSSHGVTLSIITCVFSSLFSLTAVLGNGTIMIVICNFIAQSYIFYNFERGLHRSTSCFNSTFAIQKFGYSSKIALCVFSSMLL